MSLVNDSVPSNSSHDLHSPTEERLQQLMLRHRHSHISRSLTTTNVMNVARQGGNSIGRSAGRSGVAPSTISLMDLSPSSRHSLSQLLISSRNSQIEQHVPRSQQVTHGSYQEAVTNTTLRLPQQAQGQSQFVHMTPLLLSAMNQQQHMGHLQHGIRILQQQNQRRMIDSAIQPASSLFRPSTTRDSTTSTTMPSQIGLTSIPTYSIESIHQDLCIPRLGSSFLQYQPSIQATILHATNPTFRTDVVTESYSRSGVHGINDDMRSLHSSVPLSLPALLARANVDELRVSEFQCLLRQQIEVFEAGDDDVMTHVRGRNKPVSFGQVGLRCIHCAHLSMSRHQKGSTYFPSIMSGIYQAAQNMSNTHIQCGLCDSMPDSIIQQFAYLMNTRHGAANHGAGRLYWAKSASCFGLVDTERHGMRHYRHLPLDAVVVD
jgi:hypothetical protein